MQPFTQQNRRFQTNERKGFPHGEGAACGSVLREPISHGENDETLWLEHIVAVREPRNGPKWEGLWFMWYDKAGQPTIKESAVFDVGALGKMVECLADFRNLL